MEENSPDNSKVQGAYKCLTFLAQKKVWLVKYMYFMEGRIRNKKWRNWALFSVRTGILVTSGE